MGDMAQITFLSRKEGEELARQQNPQKLAFDVSSYAPTPYNVFSPFTYSPKFEIPVPGGQEGKIAHSVESIWQGLKLIDGATDFDLFERRPYKRKGLVDGHLYNGKLIGVEEARWKIYLPAYQYYVEQYVPRSTIDSLLIPQREGKRVFVYDVEDNGDITNPKPLAHASVLALYLNLIIDQTLWTPQTDGERLLSYILTDTASDLEDKAEEIQNRLSNEGFRQAFLYKCVEHPQNFEEYRLGNILGRQAFK